LVAEVLPLNLACLVKHKMVAVAEAEADTQEVREQDLRDHLDKVLMEDLQHCQETVVVGEQVQMVEMETPQTALLRQERVVLEHLALFQEPL
jgi:hypothetical protein